MAAFGAARLYGTAEGTSLKGIVRGMVATPDYKGYWMVGTNGGVLAFGDAGWYGSASKLHLTKHVVGMAATPDGGGYWLVASDGGIFAFGDAGFYGSTGQLRLNRPIVGIAATPDGRGYWLVASDGGVFAFGDARFYGSVGQRRLNEAVTGIVPSVDGRGYFIVAKDGGVFAFGDARFLGSLPSKGINARVAAVAPTYDNGGYYVLATSGKVYTFGDATPAAHLEAAGSESLSGRAVAIVCHRSLYQGARVRAARQWGLPARLGGSGAPSESSKVGVDHHADEIVEADLGFPAEHLVGSRCVADEQVHLGRSQVTLGHPDMALPVEPDVLEGDLAELPHRVRFTSCDHVIARGGLLEHHPHGPHEVACVAPVTLGIEVPELHVVGQAELDAGNGMGHLAGHELEPPSRALVVEQDARTGMHVVALPVVDRRPVPVHLGDPVGAARVERRPFVLRALDHLAEHLR